MTTNTELRGMLLALKEDIDDQSAWNALWDWGEERGEWSAGERDTPFLKGWVAKQACILQAPTRQGQNTCEYVQFHSEYAEPGYSGNQIATGDWNTITAWDDDDIHITLDDTPKLLGDLLERLGFDLQWSDEWSDCHSCGAPVRTSPDSMYWQPSYHLGDGELLCLNCHDDNTDYSEE